MLGGASFQEYEKLCTDRRGYGADKRLSTCLVVRLFKSIEVGTLGIEIMEPHYRAKMYAPSRPKTGTATMGSRVVRLEGRGSKHSTPRRRSGRSTPRRALAFDLEVRSNIRP